ncbi:MAG: hypothetical protein KKA52_06280, partial [Candidatus Omnitrophica bacterium]|nr:hypothetical protein [Candidatus Omnitrophota bacterium]
MKMDRKRRVNTIFRITALVLVQVFLLLECGWAGGGSIIPRPQTDYPANLSPRVCIDISQFQNVFYQQITAVKNTADFKPPLQITQIGNNQNQKRNRHFVLKILKEEAEQVILEAHRDIKADYDVPYWKNLDPILYAIDKELGLELDEIGNLYAVCDVWAEKAKERLGVLDFIEFAEILHVGFH